MSVTDQMKTLLAQSVAVAQQAASSAAAAAAAAASVADKAPINSPVFTGNPKAPTAAFADNSQSIATTAFIAQMLGAANGIATLGADGKLTASQLPPISVTAVFTVASQAAMLALSSATVGNIAIRTDISNAEFILTALPPSTLANWTQIGTSPVLSVAGLTGAISAGALLTALAAAPLASPTLTGTPAAPTAVPGTNTTQIATTAFVAASFAPLASPTLTGTPLAPTATIDTNTGQIATTAFVLGQGSQSGDGVPAMDGIAARGTSTHFARSDHVHPKDTSLAPLASPIFSGNPQAPTAAPGDNSTSVATTAFVQAALGGGASTGDIKPTLKTTADSGWVMMNDGSIGDASSGATTRANADCWPLFAILWNNISNTNCPVQDNSGTPVARGANAAADFAAHRRIVTPKALGRALGAAGAGSGLTSRALGDAVGTETVTLSPSQLPSLSLTAAFHFFTAGGGSSATGPYPAGTASPSGDTVMNMSSNVSSSNTAVTVTDSNGGGSHPNVQPTSFVNWMIKL